MVVSINGGTPKWMVWKEKSDLEMDDDWGYPHFRKPLYGTMMCMGVYILKFLIWLPPRIDLVTKQALQRDICLGLHGFICFGATCISHINMLQKLTASQQSEFSAGEDPRSFGGLKWFVHKNPSWVLGYISGIATSTMNPGFVIVHSPNLLFESSDQL